VEPRKGKNTSLRCNMEYFESVYNFGFIGPISEAQPTYLM